MDGRYRSFLEILYVTDTNHQFKENHHYQVSRVCMALCSTTYIIPYYICILSVLSSAFSPIQSHTPALYNYVNLYKNELLLYILKALS